MDVAVDTAHETIMKAQAPVASVLHVVSVGRAWAELSPDDPGKYGTHVDSNYPRIETLYACCLFPFHPSLPLYSALLAG